VHGTLNYRDKEDIALLRQVLGLYQYTRQHITANWNHYVFNQLVIHSNRIQCPSDNNAFITERENEVLTLFACLTTS
jgi:hypothetical protein